MATAHTLVSGAIIGVANAPGRERVLVTVDGDGVTCYDINTKSPIKSWALGSGSLQLSTPAVYDRTSLHYFVATHTPGGHSTLLAWNQALKTGTLQQVATHIPLPSPAAAVVPSGGAAGRRHDGGDQMDVDASATPSVFVAHQNGAVSLCSPSSVVSECTEAADKPLLAAAAGGNGVLHTVHAVRSPSGSSILLGQFTVRAGRLMCESLHPATAPREGLHPIAATWTSSRAAVVWSDGSFAAYDAPTASSQGPTAPVLIRRLKDFALSRTAEAPIDKTPAGKTPGRRKRGHADANGVAHAASGAIALAGVGGGVVAIAGWSSGNSSSAAVRLVAVDVMYGAVQCAINLTADDIGAGHFNPGAALQGVAIRGFSGRLALAAGGAALVADLDVRPATLAGLIGALSLPSPQGDHGRKEAAGLALAASAALHEDDLAELVGPKGAAAGGLRCRIEAEEDGDEVLTPGSLTWDTSSAQSLRAAEAAAWNKLLDASDRKKGLTNEAFASICTPLFARAEQARARVSYDLLCKLLLAAAESGLWAGVKLVLDKQHPHSLAGCPGLASSLAAAHHFDTLHAVLHGATDLTSGEIASVVRAIVTAPGPEAAAARRKYAARIRSTAAAAVEAAEKAADAGASNAGSLVAVAACAAGTVEGFSSWQLCLHPLVAMRHDPSVLLAALRELSAAHALALLRYMLQWLRNFRTIIADCHVVAADVSALEIPGPTTVIEWFSLILDASMARLALREESAAVLAEVQKEVAPQVAALRQLARVKGAVEHLQCGAPLPLPSQGAVGRYTMEWLSLRVAS